MNSSALAHQLLSPQGSVGDPGVRPRYVGFPARREFGGGFDHRRMEEERRRHHDGFRPQPPMGYDPYANFDPNYQPIPLVGDPAVRPRFPGQMGGYDPFGARGVGAPVVNHGMHPRPLPPGDRAIAYHDMEYVAGDVTYFGLGITTIGAGATVDASLKPLRPIVPQKILIPSTTTGLLLLQVSIGGTEHFRQHAGRAGGALQ